RTLARFVTAAIFACASLVAGAQSGSNSTRTADSSAKAKTDSTRPARKRTPAKKGTTTRKAPVHTPRVAPTNPGWPVAGPTPLPGAILPTRRIIAFYGNPFSKRMGILGELPPDEMLQKLDREVAAWSKADTATP